MTTTAFPLPAMTQTAVTRTGGWMAKRGILLVFLQMPAAALMVGYVLRLISFPVASFAVFVSSAAFPAWVSYRISISDDPDEPVHDLHRYAARALAAVAAFTVALMPVLMAADIDFWRLWSDLGAELTGEAPAGSWSLVAGVVVYGLVATCLATSYFALVRRPRRHRLRGRGRAPLRRTPAALLLLTCTLPLHSSATAASEGKPLPQPVRVLTIDHLVDHVSTVPANAGEPVQLHLRERVRPGVQGRARHRADRTVLFIPGAATSAVPAYDLGFDDYSWMAYLARAGFDVFAIDLTGYGHSPRPKMDDPCNVSQSKQQVLVPYPLAQTQVPCPYSYPFSLTNTASEQDELDAAVDYIRSLRGVDRVSLVGWSLGALRAGLYAAVHPDKVDRLVFNGPNYARTSPSKPPGPLPRPGFPMDIRTYSQQVNWPGLSSSCAGQVDNAVKAPMWAAVQAYDPVGASWGPTGPEGGVMRFPTTTQWGFNATAAKKITAPTLIVRGELDTPSSATRANELFEDLGSANKALRTIPCASHFMIWESQRHELHRLSSTWLANGALPAE